MNKRVLAAAVIVGLTSAISVVADDKKSEESKPLSWGKKVQCAKADGQVKSFAGNCPKGWALVMEEN